MKIKSRPDAIAKLMTRLVEGLPEATSLFAEALESNQKNRSQIVLQLRKAEEQADERHNAFLAKVEDTFITPFDREDLLSMAEVLDDVIDNLDHAADLLTRFELEPLPKAFIAGGHDLNEMGNLAVGAVEMIKKPKKFRVRADEIALIENRMDCRYNEILADILSGKHEVFVAMKLQVIADMIEQTANMIDNFVSSLARAAIKET
jgi:uncharacterized protein